MIGCDESGDCPAQGSSFKVTKPIIFDSGANLSILSDITHVDTNTIPLCRRAENASGMTTAAGVKLDITGRGIIVGLEGQRSLGR